MANSEIWPGYYKKRYEEFIKFYQLFPKKNFEQILEVGCGIGYQSAFLSCIGNKVIATDVDFGNMKKHSRGIDLTKGFIQRTGRKNIEVKIADAQKLPFTDESFDFIYCSYSFQYVPDKNRALQEIRRVLKTDGYFFCVVPTAAYTIKISFSHYYYLIKRMFRRKLTADVMQQRNVISPKRKWYDYLKKLFPISDDADNNFISEIFSRFPSKWKKLFKKNHYTIQLAYTDNRKNFISKITASFFSTGLIIISKKK